MLKQRREAAVRIASSLRSAEQATETAMVAAAELNTVMLTSRAAAKLSVVVGQDALDSAAAAYASFAQGMRHIVDAHQRLREAQTQVGLDRLGPQELGFGDNSDCPPISPAATRTDRLRVVA